MVIIGLVLLVLAVLFALGVIFSSSGPDLEFFGQTFEIPNAGGLFLAGIITAAVAGLGLALLLAGLARAKRRRNERKMLKREGHDSRSLQAENARLASELEQTRHSPGGGRGAAPAHGDDERTQVMGDRPVYPNEGRGSSQDAPSKPGRRR